MPAPLHVAFVAGQTGIWRIDRVTAVTGASLPAADRLAIVEGAETATAHQASWILRGVTSNTRYTNRNEVIALAANQAGLQRPQATLRGGLGSRSSQDGVSTTAGS